MVLGVEGIGTERGTAREANKEKVLHVGDIGWQCIGVRELMKGDGLSRPS